MPENELVAYDQFRTGYTFKDIRDMLQCEAKVKDAQGEHIYITRRTVLGRWHQIKQMMYQHEEDCYEEACIDI
jgi:hypothetical protein